MKSRWSVDIPSSSLPSLIFGSPDSTLSEVPAYIDADQPELLHLSFQEYALWAKRIAAGLLKRGLKPQDRVLIYSGNNIFFPVVFMGIIMAGGVVSTANPAFVARELAHQLQDSEPRFLLIAETSLQTALQAATMANYSHQDMFIFDDAPLLGRGADAGVIRHWQYLIGNRAAGLSFQWEQGTSPKFLHRTVAILYSSGTTGVPKGVEITQYGLVANCCQMNYLYNLHPELRKDESNTREHRLLCVLPMYHGLGLLAYSTMAPYRRQSVVIVKRYNLAALFRNIEGFQITELMLPPPIVVAMAKSPEAKAAKYDLSSIRKVHAGAAPLSRETCAEFEKLFAKGQINVKQGWGMTEIPVSVLGWDDRQVSNTQAVGEPVPNCEAKLMDDDGINEVSRGERGELWVKGPQLMKGYWKKPEATRDTIAPGGWLKTGDIAFQDEDGKFSIVDRKKELIKVKGNQVAPAELEALLLEHPDVQDAAVIGIKVEEDERPLAYVVKKPATQVQAQDILHHMNERTAKIKWLCGIRFTTDIPKNPSGKILRRHLRDRAALESATASETASSAPRARL